MNQSLVLLIVEDPQVEVGRHASLASAGAPQGRGTGAGDERRSVDARPLVGRDLAEAPARLPVLARGHDLVRGARDEVPPHEDRLAEGSAAQQQDTRRLPARSASTSSRRPAAQVVEGVDGESLAVEAALALERHEGVLEAGLERERRGGASGSPDTSAPTIGEKTRAGERTPPSWPMSSVARPPSRAHRAEARRAARRPARSRGWPRAGPPRAGGPGGVPTFCAGVSSACAIPRPAVIRLSTPGRRRPREPEAVVVDHLPVEQPGHGLEADVGMRRHVHGLAAREGQRDRTNRGSTRAPPVGAGSEAASRRMGRPRRSVKRPGSASRTGEVVGSLTHGSAVGAGARLLIVPALYSARILWTS